MIYLGYALLWLALSFVFAVILGRAMHKLMTED
jgi:cytochrome oxidase assembly protein ShyY1